MLFSDEEIIAFLLGDAEDGLAQRIRTCLASDQELAERISHFRSLLNHLDGMSIHFEPPADLVENTLAHIDATASVTAAQGEGLSEFDHPVTSCLTVAREASGTSRSRMDSAVLTVSLTVLCCLTIPAIARIRFESRRAQCADNLRHTGQSLFEYAMRRSDSRFPFVPGTGPAAFSGVFVIRLNDEGLLPNGRLLPCASMLGIERPLIATSVVVPTLEQLHSASNTELECIKCALGGDYAYNLGFFEKGELVAPKNTGSSHHALMADAPRFEVDAVQVVAHDGKGINILYSDGHVRFVNSQWIWSGESADHPFRNMLGAHEAGLSNVDASLAPSQFPPLLRTISH
jgi:prepilin-type processing-associated H-X9-DG protein